MKALITVVLALMFVSACTKTGGSSPVAGSSSNANAAAAPAGGKVIDLPKLIAKSPEQVKQLVPVEPKFETPYLSFQLPQGTLDIDYMKGVQSTIGFESSQPVDSIEKLGDMVGIDVHGLPIPTPTNDMYFYREVKAGDKTMSTVTFVGSGGKFKKVSIDPNL